MHFSHEIFHITAVFNEISIAALFLHISNLKHWKARVKHLSKSKADTVEVESLLVQARLLGPTYESAIKTARNNDINWFVWFPWLSAVSTLSAMLVSSIQPEITPSWTDSDIYSARVWIVLVCSLIGLIISLICVAIYEKSKTVVRSEETELGDFTPPSVS
jgi:hypothetical protein